MAFSRSLQKGQTPVNCKLCETETKISWKCVECDLLMCNRCKERIHPNIKNAKNHRVVDIKNVCHQTEEMDFSNIHCKDHSGHVCFMFCKSCEQLVCPLCISKIHNGHELVEISEGYKIQLGKLQECRNQNGIKIKKLTKGESKLKEIKKIEYEKYVTAKEKIQAHNISLKKAVDQHTDKLIKDLDQEWESVKTGIEKEEGRVDMLKKKKIDKNNIADDIINSNDVEKIFEETKELEKYLKENEKPLNLSFCSIPLFVPGEIKHDNFGILQKTSSNITLKILNEYTTEIPDLYLLSACADSIWISDQKSDLHKVKPGVNNLDTISRLHFKVNGMAVSPSNDLLIAPRSVAPKSESMLKMIRSGTDRVKNTSYSIGSLCFTTVHVTNDNKVVVGAMSSGPAFPVTGRRSVIVMDNDGTYETIYEFDINKRRIFTYPRRITSTQNGNIFVVDKFTSDHFGRVVVLIKDGGIHSTYTGYIEGQAFKPATIATTPSDNIIVPEKDTHTLHLLNNMGHFITHINTRDIGIRYPFSIAFTTTENVYIGSTRGKSIHGSGKLYEVDLSGC